MKPGSQRFVLNVLAWVRPLFLIIGATQARSHVAVEQRQIRAQLGYYKLTVPIEKIVSVERSRWPWYSGLGIRTNLKNTVALVGAFDGVVLITLNQPVRATVLRVPVKMTKLYLSLDDPDQFIEAVQRVSRQRP